MGATEYHRHSIITACAVYGTLFSVLSALSIAVLVAVNWRPWRIYSWIYARKWPWYLQGPQLNIVSGCLSWGAWGVVVSPIVILIVWGVKLIILLDHDTIGLAVIMAGTALLLAFYAVMLWWRTQWQSSRAVFVLLLLAVTLLCGYELSAVYVSAGRSASRRYSPSAFFFGVSAIALGINMLFICKMVFHGAGLDVDEYVRRSYKFAHADCIEVGPVACMPEPPDPRDPALQKRNRASRFALLYVGSVLVLVGYSVLYGLTARKARWLGGVTSAAVLILDANVGACLFGFELLRNRVVALIVAGIYRIILLFFGVNYWEGFCKKGLGSSSSFSEGVPSSVIRSSSAEAGQLGIPLEATGIGRGSFRHPGEISFGVYQQGFLPAHHGSIGVIEECAEGSSADTSRKPSPIDYGKSSGGLEGIDLVEENDDDAPKLRPSPLLLHRQLLSNDTLQSALQFMVLDFAWQLSPLLKDGQLHFWF